MIPAPPVRLEHLIDRPVCNAIVAFEPPDAFQPARMASAGRHNDEMFRVDTELSLRLQSVLSTRFSIHCTCDDLIEIYRYTRGQYVELHADTPRRIARGRLSDATLLIYLNDDFDGGRTLFPLHDLAIAPSTGSALIFEHGVPHAAEAVRSGVKFVARLNLAYSVLTATEN